MAVELEIRDGTPWWASPDIWTVPDEPEGLPGSPVAGQPCYLWARVRNRGDSAVQNATVRYYWANPNVGFDRTTATLVGTSFVSLAAGEMQDVLCLTPWIPVFVNGGHECVLAEAFHPALDPLPDTSDFCPCSFPSCTRERAMSLLLRIEPKRNARRGERCL